MKTIIKILLIALVPALISTAYSQDSVKTYPKGSVKTVILSKLTGEVIDKSENEKYEVFPYADNIDSIKILWSPEKKYFVNISMHDKSKSKEFQINEENIIRLTERIELKNVMNEGYFRPGLSEISIDTSATTMTVKFRNEYFEEMPWVKKEEPTNKFRPIFGFGGGIKYFNMDLSEIKGFYDFVEQSVTNAGYSIASNGLDNGPNIFYALNFYVYLAESFGVYFEAGKGTGSKWDSYYTSGSLKYYINFGKTDWLKLYLGGGYTKAGFKGTAAYNARISGYTQNGSYWMLKDITTSGSSSAFTINLGTDIGYFGYKDHVYFTVFADASYCFFPNKEYTNSITIDQVTYSRTSSAKMKGFLFTSGIKIYL